MQDKTFGNFCVPRVQHRGLLKLEKIFVVFKSMQVNIKFCENT